MLKGMVTGGSGEKTGKPGKFTRKVGERRAMAGSLEGLR